MKQIHLFFILMGVFFIYACPSAPPNPDPASSDISAGESSDKPVSQSIVVKVTDEVKQFKALKDVTVDKLVNGNRNKIGDTDATGKVEIKNFTAKDTFVFTKNNYVSTKYVFNDVRSVKEVNLYLKRDNITIGMKRYAMGTVFNKNGVGLDGIKVENMSSGDDTLTADGGKYILELKTAAPVKLGFTGKSHTAQIDLIVVQDTNDIDIYIDDIIGLDTLKQ